MTPQLQQAIRLLQLSSMELQVEIQEALESNMMLESVEDAPEDPADDDKAGENPLAAGNVPDEPQDITPLAEPENIPDELAVDSAWEDTYESSVNISHHYEGTSFNFENQNSNNETLGEHLLWQLNLSQVSDTDRAIAITIIDALDDDGYLNCDLDEIHFSLSKEIGNEEAKSKETGSEETEIGLDEIEAVLHMIQAMEPTGVGARDLQECLILQLRQCDKDTPSQALAIELVSKHLDLLASRDFKQLMKRLRVDQKELQDVIALIQSMNPRPGGDKYIKPAQNTLPLMFM